MNKSLKLLSASAFFCTVSTAFAAAPTDNPVAAYYDGPEGYPAWTGKIRWSNVLDMSEYRKGRTDFERFENARDQVAAQGGGVLYYPAGTYDFTEGPFQGPEGRGLMLKQGVVIRGEAPEHKSIAARKDFKPPTRFLFGFEKRENAIETGSRASVWLEGGVFRGKGRRQRPVTLQLAFQVKAGKIQSKAAKAYSRAFPPLGIPLQVTAAQKAGGFKLKVVLDPQKQKEDFKGQWVVSCTLEGDKLAGSFKGTFNGRKTSGDANGRFFSVTPETPKDWNIVGLCPCEGERIKDISNVGIVWVHLAGATVYFGPDNEWGDTWGSSESWKSRYVKDSWKQRVPDGTHPWDPLAGGRSTHIGSGSGRLVFGCLLEDAVVVNNSITMGRPDTPEGFGPEGFYMAKFGPRIGAYGSRVFVSNNRIAKSTGRNFKYLQLTRYTYPGGRGNSMAFGEESVRPVLFDYNKAPGIDINKTLLGLTGKRSPEEADREGFFAEGVVVRDNWVYNHGHKGFNVSGTWVTIRNNRDERDYLLEARDPYYIGGWELTLGGYLQSSPGGNGAISDNLCRAFDLAGHNLWVHKNTFNNTGSHPGNDGEGILCQAHGGTHVYSWALTSNTHKKGEGESGYMGGWNVHIYGALMAWNKTPSWVGGVSLPRPPADFCLAANQAKQGTKGPAGAMADGRGKKPAPPSQVEAEVYNGDGVKITWTDNAETEIGFRVERRIENGNWTVISYRPPHKEGSRYNRTEWVDFLAPAGKKLVYRVVAIDSKDTDMAASKSSEEISIPSPKK